MDFIRIRIDVPIGYILKIGMPYLMYGKDSFYYLRFVHEGLKDLSLIPYMKHGQVLIFY